MGLQDWNPKLRHVTRGLKPGQFITGKNCLVAAGPPYLQMLDADPEAAFATASAEARQSVVPDGDIVYPLALLQSWALGQNKALSRLFEMGSDRTYFASGHTVGQLTLSHLIYHGPNLLRMLLAWLRQDDVDTSPFAIPTLLKSEEIDYSLLYPWDESDVGSNTSGTPAGGEEGGSFPLIEIEPGWENHFFNLASDAFDLPFGMLFLLRDSQGRNVSSFYLEQCMVPAHNLAVDAQGVLFQESATVHYDRMVPIPVRAISLLNGLKASDSLYGGRH